MGRWTLDSFMGQRANRANCDMQTPPEQQQLNNTSALEQDMDKARPRMIEIMPNFSKSPRASPQTSFDVVIVPQVASAKMDGVDEILIITGEVCHDSLRQYAASELPPSSSLS